MVSDAPPISDAAYPRETSGSLRFGLIDGPWADVRKGHVEAAVLGMALEAELLERAGRLAGGRSW